MRDIKAWRKASLCIVALFSLLVLPTSAAQRLAAHTVDAKAEQARSAIRAFTLSVDATDAPRGVFHARLTIPVSPGPLTLVYPKWIPGEHGPTGPILQLMGLKLTAQGKPVSWQRDSVEMYAFHCVVPPRAATLDVSLDYLSPVTSAGNGYGNGANATAQLAVVLWNHFVLYPQGHATDNLIYRASLRLPMGWKYGTALPISKETSQSINFEPVSLTRLIDSPLIAGAFFRSVPLASDKDSSAQIDIVADSEAALAMSPDLIAHYKQVVAEAGALFGARHYLHYHWLLTLSDAMDFNGLEHHESSDNRAPERILLDEAARLRFVTLLPHEYVHLWNGKYRRPAGLATSDYQQPMQGNLLWVYEGLTRYLGDFVLTSRARLRNVEETHEYVAWVAANLDNNRPGRAWRPLADTAIAAQLLYGAPGEWAAFRRAADFYDEGLLIWLEADAIIRERSGGRRSLDDFCRSFHGGQVGPYIVKPYTFDDVVATLNTVAPYDWRGFFNARLNSTGLHAPLGGIEASGWRVVYTDSPNLYLTAREHTSRATDLSFSLGLWLREDGTVSDVVQGLPAYNEGISPGMKVITVNGRKWSPEVMHEELKAAKTSTRPLELLVEKGAYQKTVRINYKGGERYPHLERNSARPDLIEQIIKPLT
ncbi:MAG: hypothetical protein QOJ02_2606 [Acidobacteriota bacterium]|jgi:predicted metalloprotease with PDZ domain|nr:hypothetical protein [Acidobacteriota bacterium]